MGAPNLDNYVEVADRIIKFHEKFPDGTLQSEYEYHFDKDTQRPYEVIVKATAYRSPEDPRPAVGLAAEPIPGTTPYTKNSELQNAETAAWGRAIIALGAAQAKTIASREEVRNRQPVDNKNGLARLSQMCVSMDITTNDQKREVAADFERRYGMPFNIATNEDLIAYSNLVLEGAIKIGYFDDPAG